jgi:hypothetical protein
MDAFDELRKIQSRIGYEKGEINVVAILGLVGESGEALGEWVKQFSGYANSINYIVRTTKQTVGWIETIDELKKKIRDKFVELELPHKLSQTSFNEQEFDEEIAHTLYYLHALMINRGKTIQEYAELTVKLMNDPKWKNTDVRHCIPKLVVDSENGK